MPNRLSFGFHNWFRNREIALHELSYLFWECTQRCNLKCLHCGSDCVSDSTHPDMPFEDFQKAILPLKEYYPKDSITVVITGGEPLLRKDLPDCGRELRRNGFRWGIVSNGYAYTEDIHYRLLASGMGAITVSLDGLEPEHNWLRVNGKSFANAVRALELISSSDRLNYDVVTCVNKKNINQLTEIKEFLISKGVKAWRLFTIAPIGRAACNDLMQLSDEELKNMMDFISEARNDKRIDTKFSCEAYVGRYERRVRDSFFFCRAGVNIGSVLIDGSISACPNIDRSFAQGNIYNDDLISIWQNKFSVMRDRKWCNTGLCKDCKEFKNCNGGAMHLWNSDQSSIKRCIYREL